MNEIDLMIDDLSLCDHSTSTPEVSDSVNLSVQELETLIEKIKDYSNIDKNASDGIDSFNKKVKDNQLTKIAAPSLWQRLFGAPARDAPVRAPAPSRSLTDRILGLQPSDRTDRSRAQWNGYAQHPDSVPNIPNAAPVPNIPNATPVYQAHAYYENENENSYRKGGRKRTRKSQRKI
jgi:hypothetical protein